VAARTDVRFRGQIETRAAPRSHIEADRGAIPRREDFARLFRLDAKAEDPDSASLSGDTLSRRIS
jgi:hypothetical protein